MGLVTMVTDTSALLTDTTRPSGHKVGQSDRHKASQIGIQYRIWVRSEHYDETD